MALTENDVREWRDGKAKVFARAIEEIGRLVEFFLEDWSAIWEFSYEFIEGTRVKDAPRIYAKALRRGLKNPDHLLQRSHVKGGRNRFPVHDLLGVRVLVLSLNHVAALRRAVEDLGAEEGDHYPFGNAEDFDLEDINDAPRPGGYRALHIDGSVTVREGETEYTVPFEIQVKTLAQHVYGQHTHDEAYVPDEENEDPRYQLVKSLQEALAEQLNGVDLLLAQIEVVAGAVRDDIARRSAGPEVSSASVANAVRDKTGHLLRESDASKLADFAHKVGLTTSNDFAALVDPTGDEAAAFAGEFKAKHGRRPSTRELVEGVIGRYGGNSGFRPEHEPPGEQARKETPEERERLNQLLEVEPPANPLDEIDPEADVHESETKRPEPPAQSE